MTSVELLLRILDEAFDKKSWHGTNLRGSIRGMMVEEAAWRPKADRHNIWEHVLHAAYWKYTVKRRLLGEKRGSFPLKGSNWFARPIAPRNKTGKSVESVDELATWKADVKLLVDTHQSLRAAVQNLRDNDLNQMADGGNTSILSLVTGIAAHDLYHAGQIQLLKRMYTC